LGYILEFAVNIHSPIKGKKIKIKGKIPKVSELKSSPRPSIWEELF